jgi:cytidylate kinase
MKITIGGLSGTGTSSVGKALAKHYSYEFVSGGNFARQIAMENGMTMEERDKYLLDHPEVNDAEKIDGMQKEYGKTKDNFVLESRLGWFNIPDSIKIKLKCSDEVRFQRTSKQDPERFGTTIEDFENTKKKSLDREENHRASIEHWYGIQNLNDNKHFDFILDNTDLNFEQVLQKCIEYIDSRNNL